MTRGARQIILLGSLFTENEPSMDLCLPPNLYSADYRGLGIHTAMIQPPFIHHSATIFFNGLCGDYLF
ncbi:3597_t:CDS:2 [Dentiscutata heterogama]|uniref:3597_t:CDS:1 n=1 Tax=Dentiscutata heterogama TaxID=1316150 RepID=A0ACA9KFC2_9GLOM|nr:3597_t:CDS:2 [Dentiscutata heterogama]